MIAALTASATCSIMVIKMMETVCWLCHTCRLKSPAGPIFHATSCNLYACNLYYTIIYTTFIKTPAGKDWLLTGVL